MGYYINRLLISIGWKICPICGSDKITERGFTGYNRRYECGNCGAVTRFWW